MDYAGLDAWDGRIHAEALNRDHIREAIAAVDLWGVLGSLKTEKNFELFRDYGRSLESIASASLYVEISCVPTDAAILATTPASA